MSNTPAAYDVIPCDSGSYRRYSPDRPLAVKAAADPAELDCEIGSLVIRARKPKNAQVARTEVLLDGKPIAARKIVLTGEVGRPWHAEIEFYP